MSEIDFKLTYIFKTKEELFDFIIMQSKCEKLRLKKLMKKELYKRRIELLYEKKRLNYYIMYIIYNIMDFTILNKTIALVAKRNSGKSVLLKYLVEQEEHYKKIFVICPTKFNGFYDNWIEPNCIFEDYDEEWTEKLISKMSKINQGKTNDTADHILLILDDCCSDTKFHASKSIKKLFSRGRHSFISIIITCQMLHHIPPILRCNSDFLIIGQLNAENLNSLSDEFRIGLDKKDFIKMYKRLTTDYSFLIINNNSLKDSDDLNLLYGAIKAKI